MPNSTAASNFLEQKPTLKVRVFKDEEFASMNRIKHIAYFKPVPTQIFTV
jgi:hypothetical protein